MANLSTLLSAQSNLVTDQDLAAVATTGSYTDLTNKPTIPTGSYADLTNKPTLATVAGTGSYADLLNKPALATVATSGSYADLSNKPTIISLKGTSVTYPGNDLAADPAGSQTILITGTGFESTPTVYVGGTIAPAVTFVSSTQITFTTPAKAAGTYDIYIVNPGGATAIMVFGISYSGTPTWTTAAGSLGAQEQADWTIQLQATSNSAVTYALTSGSTLPTGVTLNSSGLITGTNVTEAQTFNFSVTATDAELQDTPRSFSVSISFGDPYFRYTTLLLTGDGTNAAQNNIFLDSSTNNFTITRSGNVTQGTFSPYGNNWSNSFARGASLGEHSRLTFPNNEAYKFGTGDFTIEAWINPSDLIPAEYHIIAQCATSGSWTNGWTFYINNNQLGVWIDSNGYHGGTAVSPGVWTHVAVSRQGTTIKLFVNGDTINTQNSSFNIVPSQALSIASEPDGSYAFPSNIFISNLRIVKGTAVYTNNFVPSTTPLTAVSGTSLLTCQSNRFVDNSSIAAVATVAGNPGPRVERFNPFGASAAYSTGVIAGSGSFDGSGDYLTTPSSSQFTAAGDFTVSCWFYLQSLANAYYVVGGNWSSSTSDEWLIQVASDGSIRFLTTAGASFSSAGVVKLNQWTYFTATRSGTTVTVQLNGTTVSTYTKSDTLGATNKTIYIGRQVSGDWPFNGYITDFRLLSGSAITTIPTAPVSSTSTGLLLSMTNGAIFDNAMMHDIETVGNAQISTSVKKYGTGSLAFDGTGDYLSIRNSRTLALSSSNFTIEAWVYANALGSYNGVIAQWPDNGGTANNSYVLESVGYDMQFYWVSGTTLYGPATLGTITTGSWIHYAICRIGNTLYPFKNGILGTTVSITQTLNSPTSAITIGGAVAGGGDWNGYIDDLRVTKGYARYTANFTPPTSAHGIR